MDQPEQEQTKRKKMAEWIKRNGLTISTIFSIAIYIFVYIENSRTARKIEDDTREIRQMVIHSNETDFALRLSGLKQTATITENAMIEQYRQNLERLTHAKQTRCSLPPNLDNVLALPNYVPVATIYLQEKQKIQEKESY